MEEVGLAPMVRRPRKLSLQSSSNPPDATQKGAPRMNGQDEATQTKTAKRSCRAEGCSCEDSRIVSRRRAAFHAALARAAGQTADRQIAPDPDWQLPVDPAED